MSRLIEIDLQIQPEGYEFRYYTFDELSNLEVTNIESTLNSITDIETKEFLVMTFKASLLVMIFCKNYNKKRHLVKIS